MKANFQSKGGQPGQWLGRAWLKLVRLDWHCGHRLEQMGLPRSTAAIVMWIIKLSVLAAALYLFLVVAVIAIACLIIGRLSYANLAVDKDSPQWGYGLLGYGLYDKNGSRVDIHDPNELP